MAYNPPGVEVTQVQKSNSPTLIEPDLAPAVVGPAYKVVSIGTDEAIISDTTYQAVQKVVDLTNYGLNTSTMKLDQASVYVDLVMPPSSAIEGVPAETRLFVASGVTVGGITVTSNISTSSTTVTIPAIPDATVDGVLYSWKNAIIHIGWRALRSDLATPYNYTSLSELTDDHDDISTLNPLGYAANQARANGNTSFWTYGTKADEFNNLVISGTASSEHDLALEEFGLQEVYTLAPLTVTDAIISSYKTHANSFSAPAAKKERIVVAAPKIGWYSTANPALQRSTTALSVSTKAGSMAEKRVFYVFPDVAFIQESRHISTLNPSFIQAVFPTGTAFSTNVNARLLQTIAFSTSNASTVWAGKTVNPSAGVGEEIDAELYKALRSHALSTKNPFFTAYVPAPACLTLTTAVAGQVAGNLPQQGLTNVPIAGVDALKFSSEFFSEAQLNTMAQGGTYIMRQAKPGAAISSRHQLSTDMSSVEKRELSITKTVDYVSKFVRNTVSPFIGKYVINELSLTMIRVSVAGVGEFLKKKGTVNSFTINQVAQDAINKDQVNVSITIQPPYPVNKIDIQLIF